MRNDDPHELPESLRRLRRQYRPPRAPEGYLETLADRVSAPTQRPVRTRRLWPRLGAAAAVLLLLVASWWLVSSPPAAPEETIAQESTVRPVEEAYYPEVDEDFLLSVALLEAEDLVLPEEYLLEEELYLLDLEF